MDWHKLSQVAAIIMLEDEIQVILILKGIVDVTDEGRIESFEHLPFYEDLVLFLFLVEKRFVNDFHCVLNLRVLFNHQDHLTVRAPSQHALKLKVFQWHLLLWLVIVVGMVVLCFLQRFQGCGVGTKVDVALLQNMLVF